MLWSDLKRRGSIGRPFQIRYPSPHTEASSVFKSRSKERSIGGERLSGKIIANQEDGTL
jgi:hypothetical protein